MSTVERCVRAFFSAMNTRNYDDLQRLLTPAVRFDFPGSGAIQGSRRMLGFLKVLFRTYAHLEFTIQEVLVDGEMACVLWANDGRRVDGYPYSNSGVTIIRFSGDSIIYMSDYFKDTSFTEKA
jgi:ketosteroid isomerase-like protein